LRKAEEERKEKEKELEKIEELEGELKKSEKK
jgi:hypothetical protein